MEKIYETKEYILKFYTKYSRYIDWGVRFLLALLTFAFISNRVGFHQLLANPITTLGLSLVCTFLPVTMTVIFAAVVLLLQFFTLAPGAAVVSGMILIVMFSLYFRFTSGKAVILLLTPLAFTMNIPILIPIVFGLTGTPICVVPIAFGTVVYYMITYVKSYAAVIETVAESGMVAQVTTFTQQIFSNKEMWLSILSFTICLLVVYNIRRLAVDHAWKIAVAAGILANIILTTFGHVMMDVMISYVALIVGSIVAAIVAVILELFVFSVDYSRTEHLQFEDDEYYYYVKAVPKVSLAVPEKTVKKINVRQETEKEKVNIEKEIEKRAKAIEEEKRIQMELEESEIQRIIEDELRN